jgi:geranylgeranyl diphosphate synthase type II
MTVKEALSIINQEINNIKYPSHPPRLYDPIAYLLSLKGKKIRPVLTLLACNLYKEESTEAINMALAWEIFHNFTLMHDDVMDKADLRRGELTVHKKWGENTAILSGDTMLILAYKYLAKSNSQYLNELLDLFSQTASGICDGQELDMQFENRLDVTEDEYLEMICLKTAILLGGCLKSGAIIGGASGDDQQLLYDFGINLGLAFQMQDDLLDVFGDSSVFGKKIGGDILCNKKTYLLVNALNTSDEKVKNDLLYWLNVKDNDEVKIKSVTRIYEQLYLKEKTRDKMEQYYQTAIHTLNLVNVEKNKKLILMTLAKELMNIES